MFGISVPAAAAWLNVGIFALPVSRILDRFAVREIYEPGTFQTSSASSGLFRFSRDPAALPSFGLGCPRLAAPIVFGWIILLLDHRSIWAPLGLSSLSRRSPSRWAGSPSAVSQNHYT